VAGPGGPPALPTGHADDAPQPGSSVIPAPEVLDGELITDAKYARRRGLHRLPVYAIAAAIRESERPAKVTAAVVSRVKQSVRVAARGVYTVGAAEKFYLLLSQDCVAIPPQYAAEMTAYDPTSGELRTHYAGFFDPGFGYGSQKSLGSKAALEVRAHDVPFAVEHGQNICKLSFERMSDVPDRLYGAQMQSNYQGQQIALGKHFKRKNTQAEASQAVLFEDFELA
jgi:deoxycytidine triphosphate deaminase